MIDSFHYAANVPGYVIRTIEFLGKGGVLAITLLIDAAIITLGVGLWNLRQWARIVLIVVSALNLLSRLLSFYSTLAQESTFSLAALCSAIFYIWLLYYLNTPNTRKTSQRRLHNC